VAQSLAQLGQLFRQSVIADGACRLSGGPAFSRVFPFSIWLIARDSASASKANLADSWSSRKRSRTCPINLSVARSSLEVCQRAPTQAVTRAFQNRKHHCVATILVLWPCLPLPRAALSTVSSGAQMMRDDDPRADCKARFWPQRRLEQAFAPHPKPSRAAKRPSHRRHRHTHAPQTLGAFDNRLHLAQRKIAQAIADSTMLFDGFSCAQCSPCGRAPSPARRNTSAALRSCL